MQETTTRPAPARRRAEFEHDECSYCGARKPGSDHDGYQLCFRCQNRFGPTLLLAGMRPGRYEIGLHTGERFSFASCKLFSSWVQLNGIDLKESRWGGVFDPKGGEACIAIDAIAWTVRCAAG
jgi:hypothetical protein